jgi:hypothetical protein
LLNQADLLHGATEIELTLDRLASQITDAMADQFPIALCVMGGAVVFAGKLLPRLGFRSNSITCMPPATATAPMAARSNGACCRARTCKAAPSC